MNIYINCSGRSFLSGGYGEFARGVIGGLCTIPQAKVFIRTDLINKKSPSERFNALLNNKIHPLKSKDSTDYIEIVISSITHIPKISELKSNAVCIILITGSPFLGISKDRKLLIQEYDAVFFSGNIDKKNFLDFNSFDLPQPIDSLIFNNKIIDRQTSSNNINFLFVGTFNYWKGVDLAVKLFLKCTPGSKMSQLTIKCGIKKLTFSSISEEINIIRHAELFLACIFKYLDGKDEDYQLKQEHPYKYSIDIVNENKLIILDLTHSSSNEMSKLYQNSDFLICSSRGETWSMPVIEGIANGCKILIGEHIGCSKYISGVPNVEIIPSKANRFVDYDFSDRSSGGGRAYLYDNIKYHEIDLDYAAEKINKNLLNNSNNSHDDLQTYIEENFSWSSIGFLYFEKIKQVYDLKK